MRNCVHACCWGEERASGQMCRHRSSAACEPRFEGCDGLVTFVLAIPKVWRMVETKAVPKYSLKSLGFLLLWAESLQITFEGRLFSVEQEELGMKINLSSTQVGFNHMANETCSTNYFSLYL